LSAGIMTVMGQLEAGIFGRWQAGAKWAFDNGFATNCSYRPQTGYLVPQRNKIAPGAGVWGEFLPRSARPF
jgi:hypothetical protein